MVLDVWSRKVVGWAMETHLRSELVLDALNMALAQRRPVSVIHHCDHGCQYTSYAFGKRCQDLGVMSSRPLIVSPNRNVMLRIRSTQSPHTEVITRPPKRVKSRVEQARWVEDGKFVTSSGVSAPVQYSPLSAK